MFTLALCGSILSLTALPGIAAYFIATGLQPNGRVVRRRAGLGLGLLAAAIVAVFLTPIAWLWTGYSGVYTAGYAWLGASFVALAAALVMAIRLRRGRWLAAVVGLAFPSALWAGANLGVDAAQAVSAVAAREHNVRCMLLTAGLSLEDHRAAHGTYPVALGDLDPTVLTLSPRLGTSCRVDLTRVGLWDAAGPADGWLYRYNAAAASYELGFWTHVPHLGWLGPRVCIYRRITDRVTCGFNQWGSFEPQVG